MSVLNGLSLGYVIPSVIQPVLLMILWGRLFLFLTYSRLAIVNNIVFLLFKALYSSPQNLKILFSRSLLLLPFTQVITQFLEYIPSCLPTSSTPSLAQTFSLSALLSSPQTTPSSSCPYPSTTSATTNLLSTLFPPPSVWILTCVHVGVCACMHMHICVCLSTRRQYQIYFHFINS